MGAKFYFYPMPIGNQLVTISMEDLAEFYSDWEYTSDTGVTMNGKSQTTVTLNREIITISRDRFSGGEETAMKLRAMQSHLDRGYSVAFTADDTKAFCYPVSTLPVGGDTSIKVFSDPFRNMTGSNMPSANDYMVLENAPPASIHEVIKVASKSAGFSSLIGGTINANYAVNFTYPSASFLRWYRFFPILKRLEEDRGKSIVTNEHGLTFSLELRLTPDYSQLFSFHPNSESDLPSNLLESGKIVGTAEIFETPSVNLDNPPVMQEIDANLDISNNLAWNNWRNWGN